MSGVFNGQHNEDPSVYAISMYTPSVSSVSGLGDGFSIFGDACYWYRYR
jgi:hypothetical protein